MKINIIPSIIAIILSMLIALGMYSWCRCKDMNLLIAIVGGICICLTSGLALGISWEDVRKSINIKIVSSVFASLEIAINVIFCSLITFSIPAYIITIGISLLIWMLVIYGISKANV